MLSGGFSLGRLAAFNEQVVTALPYFLAAYMVRNWAQKDLSLTKEEDIGRMTGLLVGIRPVWAET